MAEEGNVGIDEFCDLITQKLLKLPQDQKFVDVKRCLRFALKAEKAADIKEALNQYISTEGVITNLLNDGCEDSTLKSIMGIVKKRIQFHQKSCKNLSLESNSTVVVEDKEDEETKEEGKEEKEENKPKGALRGGKRGRGKNRGGRGGRGGGVRNSMVNVSPAFEEIADNNDNNNHSNNNSPSRSRSATSDPVIAQKKDSIPQLDVNDVELRQIIETTLLCIFFPINNDEMGSPQKLLTLLQQSLSISQKKFDNFIDSVLQYGNFEYILLQLEYQKENVDRHKYYTQDQFRDSGAFRDWKDKENNRIDSLEERIKTTYPGTKPSNLDFRPPSLGYIEIYKLLSRGLYRFIENGGNGEDFSQSFIWLLNEYSTRYGIRELFKVIDYICTLMETFGNDSDRIRTLRSQFFLVKKLVKNGEVPTVDEAKLLQDKYEELVSICVKKLSNMFSSFNLPADKNTLSAVLELTTIIPEVSEIVENGMSETRDMVKKNLKASVKNKYEELKKEAEPKDDPEKKTDLSPLHLGNIADLLVKAVDVMLKFVQPLQEYGDVKESCCKEIVKLFLRDVETFSENDTKLYSTASILTLAVKIYQANTNLVKKYEGCTTLSVIDIFPKFVYEYIDGVKKEIFAWIKEEIENEDWEEIDEESYYSISCTELMHRLFEPADFIKKQEFMDPAKDGRKKEPFSQIYYNQVFVPAIEEYVKRVYDSFIDDFTENKDFQAYLRKTFDISSGKVPELRPIIMSELEKSSDPDSVDKSKKIASKEVQKARAEPDILAEACVRINNLVFFYDAFAKVSRRHRDDFKTDFKKIETFVEKSFTILVLIIVYWMNHKIYLEVNYFIKQKRVDGHKVSTTTDLIVYLDEQIGILSRHLDSGPFDCDLLPGLWRAVVVVMRLVLLNVTKNGKKVSGGSTKRANFVLQELRDYFYQGGKGMPGHVLDSDCNAIVNEIVTLQKQAAKEKKSKDKKSSSSSKTKSTSKTSLKKK